MTREEALRLAQSSQMYDRLRAARFFARYSTEGDAPALRKWLAQETVGWIRGALKQALQRAGAEGSSSEDADHVATEDGDAGREIYAQAMEETTARLVHEIEPILGLTRLYAGAEVPNYEASQTKRQLDRLGTLLRAIDTLSRTAAVPKQEELDFAELVHRIAEAESEGHKARIEFAGSDPMVVVGDRALLEVVFSNGLRNAIEADEEAGRPDGRVVITWGETDRDYWLAILDQGPGLPAGGASRLFDIGSTTKEGHHGMGLALARQAMASMGGVIAVRSREQEGAALECRWPKLRSP
jgi:signal transduction histidine kinase